MKAPRGLLTCAPSRRSFNASPRGAPRHSLHQPRACGGRLHSCCPSGARSRHPAHSDRSTERERLDPSVRQCDGGLRRTWAITSTPVLDGRNETRRHPDRTAHHAPRAATVLSGSTADALPYRHGVGPSDAAPFLRTDIGQGPRGKPRVVPNVQPLQLFAGGIMRGRNRSRARRPMRGREAFRRGRRISSESDAQIDESLRGLARLLARQAARDAFPEPQ